jgi:DNA modification methylase
MKSREGKATKTAKKKASSKRHKEAPQSFGSVLAMPKQKRVELKITPAKGRPMLSWVGKRPLNQVVGLPAQAMERFGALNEAGCTAIDPQRWQEWPPAYPKGGLLFYGDNKEVLSHLIANGFRNKVHLVYIDPPFDSGADYVRRVSLRGNNTKMEAETYSLGEQVQYGDIWAEDNYLQFMYERLLLLKEILTPSGSIFVHCDYRRVHHLRMVMDEVFGEMSFVNEIIWLAEGGGASGLRFGRKHQTLLYYSKAATDDERTFNGDAVRVPYKTENIKPQTYHFEANAKQRPGFKEGYTWVPNEAGKVPTDAWLDCFLAEGEGVPLDVWYDVKGLYGPSGELEEYPTQKPKALLNRIVKAASNPGDVVLDCFAGSGTTAEVAQKLGRRWIGCDINKGAIQTTAKRLQTIISEHIASAENLAREGKQAELIPSEKELGDPPTPAQLSFATYRVNDYDLAIQHNEAVNLACEHIGVERVRTDSYFDGKLGDAWVKIIPFGHPLSPTDLEELKRELDARKEDPKLIKIVCLGMELAARTWVDEWNKLRKGKQAVNRVEVIELRTDPKYGRFIAHKPAKTRVSISRKKARIYVEIKDFISPAIVERLQQQAGILQPKIDDWRAMVDCVMIDTAFNGEVFNVALTDIPERKTDFVQGTYELSAPNGKTTVAVKIIDMLGEEVLTTAMV